MRAGFFFFVLLLLLPAAAVLAQDKTLQVQGAWPSLYVNHTVAPKENYYSIGRLYNVSPKDQIAPFNGLQMDKGLSPGQVIKIPLAANNFVQDGNAGADEALVPVYHTVKEKEGLYRISVTYNKVDVQTIKQWNNIKGDAVPNGVKLIIGYLKVKKDLSALASMGKQLPVTNPVKTVEPVKQPVVTAKQDDAPVKTIPKENPPVKEPVKKDPPPVVAVKNEPVKQVEPNPNAPDFNGGVFKRDYDAQNSGGGDAAKESGAANVFKSTSGWSDGKYYCLHNTAAPGTIIKVTNTATGKSVYAKVLDVIPDIKQNAGLIIRISNAAAEELGAGLNKFDCTLSYSN